jgi:DNA-binding GntR family transcriptional regulator
MNTAPINSNLHSSQEVAPDSDEVLHVSKVLTEDIIFGRLEPGTRLVEDVLIARFEVSRYFIRRSLEELERVGIAARERNKGFTVKRLTPEAVRQIYEVRELLQRQAALRIPLPAPQTLIDRLEQLHRLYGEHLHARDFGALHEVNDLFHLTLFGACGNEYLVRSIRNYMSLTLPVRAKQTVNVDHAAASEREHKVMIDLLKGTDRWALAQLCVDHLQRPKNSYLAELGEGSDAAS